MIITRTPFRVSFAGGGSDLREFYSRHGYGAVVSTAVTMYMYIVIHPYFHDKIRIKYSRTEDVECVDDIQHPIVRECLKKVAIDKGIEIASFADVPSGTGLGSSSSFTVGLLHALYAYRGEVVSKRRLAEEACQIEIDLLGEPIGKQDQYAAAFGNLNYIRFNRDETVDVTQLLLTEKSRPLLEKRLRLYFVGGNRKAGDILSEQKKNISGDDACSNLISMVSLADQLKDRLQEGDVDAVGGSLNSGWVLKKSLAAGISSADIDRIYDEFICLGAKGGKLLGAGGTGFLLVYAEDHDELSGRLPYRSLPFTIDREGTKLIHYE